MFLGWKHFNIWFERWGFQLEVFNSSWISLYLSSFLVPSWRKDIRETAIEYGWDKPTYMNWNWDYNDLVTDGVLRLRSFFWLTPLLQGDMGLFTGKES